MDNESIVEKPFVSIIVTTYNRTKFLAETLDSILSQTFTNFEVIVVDNMSTDGTKECFDSPVDRRIKYFRNANKGVIAVNRNFGIRKARGEYIAFCDDDDIWLPEKLDRQVRLLEQHPNVALCYTHASSFSGDTVLAARVSRRNPHNTNYSQLLRGGFFPHSSVLIRSSVFQEIGLLTENPLLREDYELWLRVSKLCRLIAINESLIRYRVHPSNVSNNLETETLRSIRTLYSVSKWQDVFKYPLVACICFQYIKYVYYLIAKRC